MHVVRRDSLGGRVDVAGVPMEVTEEDERIYAEIVSTSLTEAQQARILEPAATYPRQSTVVAIHWHPEFVPMELIRRRIETVFPNKRDELIIPTQHNELTSYGDYSGVEVDCYSQSFHRKVQLLFHFRSSAVSGDRAHVFKCMCEHTRKYRTNQLRDFLDTLVEERHGDRTHRAADMTGVGEEMVELVRRHAARLRRLVDEHEGETPCSKLRNKLVRDYFDALRPTYGDEVIRHIQHFVRAVKDIVKEHLPLEYFYRTEELIEEGRRLGAGIVIPHPEQFWPILLDDLDVDGIEVWNPQSFHYTRFLIDVVNRKNRARPGERQLLVTMGDDCHLGEKIKDPLAQDPEKASREIGLQPPWDEVEIRKSLIVADAGRSRLVSEYRSRLG